MPDSYCINQLWSAARGDDFKYGILRNSPCAVRTGFTEQEPLQGFPHNLVRFTGYADPHRTVEATAFPPFRVPAACVNCHFHGPGKRFAHLVRSEQQPFTIFGTRCMERRLFFIWLVIGELILNASSVNMSPNGW